jgi:hypothetical protein
MARTPEDLELQAARESRLIDALNARFARELAQVLKLLNADARRLVRDLQTKDGRLVATRASLGRVLGLRRQLLQVLTSSGFETFAAEAFDEPLDQMTALVLKGAGIENRAAALSTADLKAIEAFKAVRFDELLNLGRTSAIRLARLILDGTLGAQRVDGIVDDVADQFDITDTQARSLYDTALSIYSRQVDQLLSTGEPDELFYYAGPLDLKTRPFCRERVGKVFTRQQLETADNGQLPNPLLTGGGYNCRHQPKRVSRIDRELLDLFERGARAPYVEDRLKALEAERKRKAA